MWGESTLSCLHSFTNCLKCFCLWNLIAQISWLFAFGSLYKVTMKPDYLLDNKKHDTKLWCSKLPISLPLMFSCCCYSACRTLQFKITWLRLVYECVLFLRDAFASLKTLSQHQLDVCVRLCTLILNWTFHNVVSASSSFSLSTSNEENSRISC